MIAFVISVQKSDLSSPSLQFLTDNASHCEGARPQLQRHLPSLRRRKRERRRLDHCRWVPPPPARTKKLNPSSNKPSIHSVALSEHIHFHSQLRLGSHSPRSGTSFYAFPELCCFVFHSYMSLSAFLCVGLCVLLGVGLSVSCTQTI